MNSIDFRLIDSKAFSIISIYSIFISFLMDGEPILIVEKTGRAIMTKKGVPIGNPIRELREVSGEARLRETRG